MPINPETKIGFIHIPRNGGSFIEHKMGVHVHRQNSGINAKHNNKPDFKHLFGNDLQHLTMADLKSLLDSQANEYTWYTIVRNPFDRLESVLCHSLNSPEALESSGRCISTLSRFLKIYYYHVWVSRWKMFFGRSLLFTQINVFQSTLQHLLPQYRFLNTPEINVNIYPFEALNQLADHLDQGLYELDKIPNRSKKKPKATKGAMRIMRLFVKTFYRRDLQLYKQVLSSWKEQEVRI